MIWFGRGLYDFKMCVVIVGLLCLSVFLKLVLII